MATLPESSRWKRKPVDHCDVVMKGGITSGVIYPRALVELARHYRFRGMGGSSAGAIGAARAVVPARYHARNARPWTPLFETGGSVGRQLRVAVHVRDPKGRPSRIRVERLQPASERGLDVDVVQDLMLHDLDWVTRSLAEEVVSFDRTMLLVAEHTWGLDQKIALPEDRRWGNEDLAELRTTPEGRRFEASWAEQRAYLDRAMQLVWGEEGDVRPGAGTFDPPVRTIAATATRLAAGWADRADRADRADGVEEGLRPVELGASFTAGPWQLAISPETGALVQALHAPSGRVLADQDHPLGQVHHQSFDESDYCRFFAQLVPSAEDEWWARWDNTKPGIDAGGARSAPWDLQPVRAIGRAHAVDGALAEVAVEARFPDEAVALGAPPTVWTVWSLAPSGDLALDVLWPDKPATRLPEATWCSFVPIVAEPARWELDKLAQRVSPLDVVRRGGRSLHAVGEGMHYDGPDGHLTIATSSAPLVAPGRPNLLDADPPVPDLDGGFHVLLHDNCWGTNFPMWNQGPAAFSFSISVG